MKLHFTESSMILPNDSTIGSLTQSRLDSFRIEPIEKRISQSIENHKTPFEQTKPLKFPKNRLRKQCSQSILTESNDKEFRACIRTSVLRNKQYEHRPQRLARSPGVFHRHSRESEGKDNFLKDCALIHSVLVLFIGDLLRLQKSLETISRSHVVRGNSPLKIDDQGGQSNDSPNNLSPTRARRQRKHFQLKAAMQVVKDPILIGQTPKPLLNLNYQKIAQEPRVKRYYGEGFKDNLQWKVNSSKEKEHFLTKHTQNATEASYKGLTKKAPSLSSTQQEKANKAKSYKEMYNSRRKAM